MVMAELRASLVPVRVGMVRVCAEVRVLRERVRRRGESVERCIFGKGFECRLVSEICEIETTEEKEICFSGKINGAEVLVRRL